MSAPAGAIDHDERRRPVPGHLIGDRADLERHDAALRFDEPSDGVSGALAHAAAVAQVHPGHARLGGERHQDRARVVRHCETEGAHGEIHDRAPFWGLVRQRRHQRAVGEERLRRGLHREELGRLARTERDRAGLVEQQRGHVARRLDGPSRHRQNVALHEPIHAGDADGGQQATDRRRDQADEEGDEHHDALLRARVDGERLQRHDRQQEHDGEAGQQDRQRDLVRRLLAVGPLDQSDHPVEERLPRFGRDPYGDLVAQHPGTAGHC